MDKDERKELTFRQMLALGADYPSVVWANSSYWHWIPAGRIDQWEI